jgi:hypothetical protein
MWSSGWNGPGNGKLWGKGNTFLDVGNKGRRVAFSERGEQAGKRKDFRERGKQTGKKGKM